MFFSVVAGLSVLGVPAADTNTLDIAVEDSVMAVTVTMENSREVAEATPGWVPVNIIQMLEHEDSPAIMYTDAEWRSLAGRITDTGVEVAAWGAVGGTVTAIPLTDDIVVEQIAVLPRPDMWGADLDRVVAVDPGISVYDERYDDYVRANDPDCVGAREFALQAAPFADQADVTVVAEPDRCAIVMTHRLPVSTDIERAAAEQFVEVFTGGAVMISGSPDTELIVDVRPLAAEVLSPAGDTAPGGTSGFIDTVTVTDADGTPVEALTVPTDPAEPAVMSGPVVASRLEHPTTTSPRSPASIPEVAPVTVPSSSPLIPVAAAVLVLIVAFAVWRAARRRTT